MFLRKFIKPYEDEKHSESLNIMLSKMEETKRHAYCTIDKLMISSSEAGKITRGDGSLV